MADRWNAIRIITTRIAALAAITFWLVSCADRIETPTPEPTATFTRVPEVFEGARALALAADFMDFGPRVTGSAESLRAGDWILRTLQIAGWETFEDTGDYRSTAIRNLAGRRGEGPVILLGAHYDSRRQADRDPTQPHLPVPGANDGASGVVVLLELARVLDLDWSSRQVWVVFFDAEDNGRLDGWDWCVGSRQFAEFVRQAQDGGVPFEAMVLVDLVGDDRPKFPLEGFSDPVLADALWDVAEGLGYGGAFVRDRGPSVIDDHLPFRDLGIPAVDIIDLEYPHWHTRADTLDKLSADSLEMVGRMLEVWLESGGRAAPAAD